MKLNLKSVMSHSCRLENHSCHIELRTLQKSEYCYITHKIEVVRISILTYYATDLVVESS